APEAEHPQAERGEEVEVRDRAQQLPPMAAEVPVVPVRLRRLQPVAVVMEREVRPPEHETRLVERVVDEIADGAAAGAGILADLVVRRLVLLEPVVAVVAEVEAAGGMRVP